MRILHIIDSGGLYGAEKMLLSLALKQLEQGLDPMILSVGEPNEKPKKIEQVAIQFGIPVKAWRMRAGLNLSSTLAIKHWALKNKFDLIHSHGFKFNVLLGLFQIKRSIPVVATIHGYLKAKKYTKAWLYELLDRLAVSRLSGAVMVSQDLLEEHQRSLFRNQNVRVIRNGVLFGSNNQGCFKILDSDEGFINAHEPVILAVGRLSKEKGFNQLIRAFSKIKDDFPNAGLWIAGDGPEYEMLIALIAEEGVQESVRLLGYRENVNQYMVQSSVLVIASSTEGLPITLLEAMKVKLPIIATDVGEIPYVLNFGECGYIVNYENPLDLTLAKVIKNVLSNPKERKLRADLAYERVKNNFSCSSMEREYYNFYLGLDEFQ